MGSVTREQRIASFETHPDRYHHWKLTIDGPVASLAMSVDPAFGQRADDYELKLNSYDMGVDIELHDAVERLRFEHPEVRAVVVTSAVARIFCAGANIKMLATSMHGFKVNFCKYTNETRLGIEDATRTAGQTWIAALNGTASGGGYELALACDEIYLIDDGNSAVSLPEVPLLGVLPGTGGLTRLVDKRKVRRDVADVFCTKAEGFRARDAKRMRLVDGSFSRSGWEAGVQQVAAAAVARSPARASQGVPLSPLEVVDSPTGRAYKYVTSVINAEDRVAHLTVRAPEGAAPGSAEALRAEGAQTWSLRAFRELEDALLHLRFNHAEIGVILLHTQGDPAAVLAHDAALADLAGDWFADEIRSFQGRVLRRIDNTARTFFALIEPGSCFVGTLFELVLAADRSYMLQDDDGAVSVQVTAASAGGFPMDTGATRLAVHFAGEPAKVGEVLAMGAPINAADAEEIGLVTFAPDEIDWDDEVRIAIEERASMSPDALTGMEQNLRFVGLETCDTKIFGRLSAWQNWIFQRPNAVGDSGALTLYGFPERPRFDWRRT
jgi:benzoyl-CoA-dihydrodiol lyase